MENRLRRFPGARTLVLGAATLTLLWLPGVSRAQSTATQDMHAQSSPTGDRQNGQFDDNARRDLVSFDRFLDDHREIAEQVRKDPSLLDNRDFVRDHPALQTYFQDNPGVRDRLRQDPNVFMRQEDQYARDMNMRDRDDRGQDRDGYHRDLVNFDRFLDGHREIAQQVRKDPSLVDNRNFVQDHPALQAYLQDNPGVRDQLRQDPNAFMHQEDRDQNMRDRDPMHDRMADFGGWLGNHPDVQKDLSRDPSRVKDHDYVQSHAELNAYLSAHPDVRDGLMANPQSFVQGAQQYHNNSGTSGAAGAGTGATGSTNWSGRSTGTTGSSTGTPANPSTTNPPPPTHDSKPNH